MAPMTAATDALALLGPDSPDTWPQGILAAADLREQRANLINEGGPGIWYVDGNTISGPGYPIAMVEDVYDGVLTEHIAAEANPAHALTAVRHWRGVVERHSLRAGFCHWCDENWPCPDLTETAEEARTYLGGAS